MILVTGGAGFIGSHLVEKLKNSAVFDLRTGQDGLNFETVKDYVKGKELVFHLANIPAHRLSVNNPYDIIKNNFLITLNFAEACRVFDAKMVFASSFGVYGSREPPFREDMPLEPKTPYGVAKKSCEELLQMYHERYGLNIIIVRPSNVWGGRDYLHEPLQVLPLWIRNLKEKKPLIVHGTETTRDFTHISDFVDGIILAGKQKGFDVFNLASGKEIRLYDIAKFLTHDITVKPLPQYEIKRWFGDVSKAKNILGWTPKKDFWKELKKYVSDRLKEVKK